MTNYGMLKPEAIEMAVSFGEEYTRLRKCRNRIPHKAKNAYSGLNDAIEGLKSAFDVLVDVYSITEDNFRKYHKTPKENKD